MKFYFSYQEKILRRSIFKFCIAKIFFTKKRFANAGVDDLKNAFASVLRLACAVFRGEALYRSLEKNNILE